MRLFLIWWYVPLLYGFILVRTSIKVPQKCQYRPKLGSVSNDWPPKSVTDQMLSSHWVHFLCEKYLGLLIPPLTYLVSSKSTRDSSIVSDRISLLKWFKSIFILQHHVRHPPNCCTKAIYFNISNEYTIIKKYQCYFSTRISTDSKHIAYFNIRKLSCSYLCFVVLSGFVGITLSIIRCMEK